MIEIGCFRSLQDACLSRRSNKTSPAVSVPVSDHREKVLTIAVREGNVGGFLGEGEFDIAVHGIPASGSLRIRRSVSLARWMITVMFANPIGKTSRESASAIRISTSIS